MSDNKQPAGRVYLHPIQATIWQNTNRDGAVFYSVIIERRYRDGDQWKGTPSFGETELLLVTKVADKAHDEILRLKAADRASSGAQAEAETDPA